MAKFITNQNWYMRDVFRWRTGASLAWSLILLPFTAGLFTLLVKINIFHPHLWFLEFWTTACSFCGIGYVILIAVLTSLQALSNVFYYTVVPVVHVNRLSVAWDMVRPSHLLHMACHTLAGGLTAWCWSSLIGSSYSALVVLSDEDGVQYLNDNHLFLVLHGAYMGCLFSIWYLRKQAYYVDFPVIQQLKFFQVKAYLWQSLHDNFFYSARATGYFFVLYYLFGSLPKHWLRVNLGLAGSPTPLDAISGLLNVALLWSAVLTGVVTTHLWGVSLHLFKVFNTEVYQFPVEAPFASQEECRLHKALAERRNLLVQYLAYRDLSTLAECGRERRNQVFSLSQPGGHPHNWTHIVTACLSLLDSVTERIGHHQECITNGLAQQKRTQEGTPGGKGSPDANGKTVEGRRDQDTTTVWYTPREPRGPYLRSSVASPITPVTAYSPAYGPVLESPQVLSRDGVQDLGTPGRESTRYASPGSGYGPLTRPSIHRDPEKTRQTSGDHHRPGLLPWQRHLDALRRWRLGAYLLSPFPEATGRALFTDAQLHIWALEALSSLVAASYREDTYGVVQGTLPDILVSMLALQSALEKHFKLPTTLPKRSPGDFRPARSGLIHPDDRLRFDLRSTVMTSLHRVVATFGPHLKSVVMAPEYKQRLTQLMEYKQ